MSTDTPDTDEAQLKKRIADLEQQVETLRSSIGISRREALAGAGALGMGGLLGKSAVDSVTDKAAAADTNAGDVGTANNPVDLFANYAEVQDTTTDPVDNGEIRRNGADVKIHSGGSVVNLSSISSSGALSDSGSDTTDGGDIYQLPATEDAIDLQSGGEIQNAEAINGGGPISEGDNTERQIWIISNGASDPAGANTGDLIFEEET